jgi:multiple antibiotic resistance protein
MDVTLFLTAFAGLFAIMNPFVALPVFLSFTEDETAAVQRRQALRVAIYSLVLASGFHRWGVSRGGRQTEECS